MSDTTGTSRQLRVTVTIEEIDAQKAAKASSENGFWEVIRTFLKKWIVPYIIEGFRHLIG
jgi:gamma-glutamylcysteine synthetase